jgi:hypothetical protein
MCNPINRSVVTSTQMMGYLLALGGVAYYNHHKILAASRPRPTLPLSSMGLGSDTKSRDQQVDKCLASNAAQKK